jgi:hypothetical protein
MGFSNVRPESSPLNHRLEVDGLRQSREEYGLLYSDADHLSESGSLFYLSNFSSFLERNRLSYHLFSNS